jgi:hypothetical protein
MTIHEVVIFIGMFLFWGWVVYIILEWRKLKHKNQLQNKIIDKLNTVPELNEFLQTEGGSRFLNFLTIEGFSPKDRLLSSISKGIILVMLGIAFVVSNSLFSTIAEDSSIFIAIGFILFLLGIGFLVSSFISYLLSKKWGIIKQEEKRK